MVDNTDSAGLLVSACRQAHDPKSGQHKCGPQCRHHSRHRASVPTPYISGELCLLLLCLLLLLLLLLSCSCCKHFAMAWLLLLQHACRSGEYNTALPATMTPKTLTSQCLTAVTDSMSSSKSTLHHHRHYQTHAASFALRSLHWS